MKKEFLVFDARGVYDPSKAEVLGIEKETSAKKAFQKARQKYGSFALYEGDYLIAWADGEKSRKGWKSFLRSLEM